MKSTTFLLSSAFALALSFQSSLQGATGSNVNEASVTTTLYASPTGNDNNPGTSEGSPKTLQGAINAAMSQNTKVILLNGDYRQYVSIPSGNTVLVLEARNAGQAAITGSDVYTNWTPETNGAFSIPWTNNWGLGNTNSWGDSIPYNLRREMVFVNKTRLLQRVDGSGNSVGPGALNAGEFTVNEGADRLYMKPPAGVSVSGSTIEVAVRGYDTGFVRESRPLLRTDHSNVVFRGLVFRHNANYVKFGPALELRGDENQSNTALLPNNYLVDNCLFTQNNGIGFEVNSVRDVTVRNSKFNDNGARGAGATYNGGERPNQTNPTNPVASKNLLFVDSQFNSNNWRAKGVWGSRNDSSGFKTFGHSLDNLTMLRCDFSNNVAAGFWTDYAGSNIVVDSCLIENNLDPLGDSYGISHEMTRGPITVKNSVIRNNGGPGFISSGSPNVILENNWIYYNNFNSFFNGQAIYGRELQMNSNTDRSSGDFPFTTDGWRITGNRIGSFGNNVGKSTIISVTGLPFPSGRTAQQEFAWNLQSNNNVWSKEINDNYYGDRYIYSVGTSNGSEPDINLATWKTQTNKYGQQDQNSTFQYPLDTSNVPNPLTSGDGGGGTPPLSEWSIWGVGSPSPAGSDTGVGGFRTITASGADIWGNSDQFEFSYMTLNGDGTLTARVDSLTNTNAWAKAGVMVRESLDANSKHASMLVTPGSGLAFQYRSSTGGSSSSVGTSGSAPRWVRVARSGSTLTGSVSTDGQTWSVVGTTTISMPGSVYIGLAVTSHNTGTLTTAEFSGVGTTSVTAINTGGTASASSAPVSSESAANAFDQNAGTKWLGSMSGTVNLTYRFGGGASYALTEYKIVSANDEPGRHPKNWTVTGSNDGTTWSAALDTQTNQTYGSAGTVATYSVNNTTAYQYYRLNVSSNNGAPLVQIADWTLFGFSPATAVVSTGGTATASSTPVGSEGPAQAFDQNAGTKWLGLMSGTVNLTYQFGGNAAYKLSEYKIISANDAPNRHPKAWTVTGSNDGTNWSAALDIRTNQSYGSAGSVNTYTVSNNTAYKYYRLNVSSNNGAPLIQIADWTIVGNQ